MGKFNSNINTGISTDVSVDVDSSVSELSTPVANPNLARDFKAVEQAQKNEKYTQLSEAIDELDKKQRVVQAHLKNYQDLGLSSLVESRSSYFGASTNRDSLIASHESSVMDLLTEQRELAEQRELLDDKFNVAKQDLILSKFNSLKEGIDGSLDSQREALEKELGRALSEGEINGIKTQLERETDMFLIKLSTSMTVPSQSRLGQEVAQARSRVLANELFVSSLSPTQKLIAEGKQGQALSAAIAQVSSLSLSHDVIAQAAQSRGMFLTDLQKLSKDQRKDGADFKANIVLPNGKLIRDVGIAHHTYSDLTSSAGARVFLKNELKGVSTLSSEHYVVQGEDGKLYQAQAFVNGELKYPKLEAKLSAEELKFIELQQTRKITCVADSLRLDDLVIDKFGKKSSEYSSVDVNRSAMSKLSSLHTADGKVIHGVALTSEAKAKLREVRPGYIAIVTTEPEVAKIEIKEVDGYFGRTHLDIDITLPSKKIKAADIKFVKLDGKTVVDSDGNSVTNEEEFQQANDARDDLSLAVRNLDEVKQLQASSAELFSKLAPLQRLARAGMNGEKTEDFTRVARALAADLEKTYKESGFEQHVEELKVAVARLKKLKTGLVNDNLEKEIKGLEAQLEAVTTLVETKSIEELVKKINLDGFDADTWGKWIQGEGLIFMTTIAAGVAAAAFTPFTGGASLAAFAGYVATVSAVSAVTSYGVGQGTKAFVSMWNDSIESDFQRAWHDPKFNIDDVLLSAGKEIGTSFVFQAAFMGGGGFIGRVSQSALASTAQGTSRTVMGRTIARVVDKTARGLSKYQDLLEYLPLNSKTALGRFGKEYIEELIEEGVIEGGLDGVANTLEAMGHHKLSTSATWFKNTVIVLSCSKTPGIDLASGAGIAVDNVEAIDGGVQVSLSYSGSQDTLIEELQAQNITDYVISEEGVLRAESVGRDGQKIVREYRNTPESVEMRNLLSYGRGEDGVSPLDVYGLARNLDGTYSFTNANPEGHLSLVDYLNLQAQYGLRDSALSVEQAEDGTIKLRFKDKEINLTRSELSEEVSSILSQFQGRPGNLFENLSNGIQAQLQHFRSLEPNNWQEKYKEKIDVYTEALLIAAKNNLNEKNVEFEEILDNEGKLKALKIKRKRKGGKADNEDFNDYAARLGKSKGLDLVYDPGMLIKEQAGALYDRGERKKTIFISHDSIAEGKPTKQVYHEKVHAVKDSMRDMGADSIVYGRAKLDGINFSLDEYVTYTEMISIYAQDNDLKHLMSHVRFMQGFNNKFLNFLSNSDLTKNLRLSVDDTRVDKDGRQVFFLVGTITVDGQELSLDLGSEASRDALPDQSTAVTTFLEKIATWKEVTLDVAPILEELEKATKENKSEEEIQSLARELRTEMSEHYYISGSSNEKYLGSKEREKEDVVVLARDEQSVGGVNTYNLSAAHEVYKTRDANSRTDRNLLNSEIELEAMLHLNPELAWEEMVGSLHQMLVSAFPELDTDFQEKIDFNHFMTSFKASIDSFSRNNPDVDGDSKCERAFAAAVAIRYVDDFIDEVLWPKLDELDASTLPERFNQMMLEAHRIASRYDPQLPLRLIDLPNLELDFYLNPSQDFFDTNIRALIENKSMDMEYIGSITKVGNYEEVELLSDASLRMTLTDYSRDFKMNNNDTDFNVYDHIKKHGLRPDSLIELYLEQVKIISPDVYDTFWSADSKEIDSIRLDGFSEADAVFLQQTRKVMWALRSDLVRMRDTASQNKEFQEVLASVSSSVASYPYIIGNEEQLEGYREDLQKLENKYEVFSDELSAENKKTLILHRLKHGKSLLEITDISLSQYSKRESRGFVLGIEGLGSEFRAEAISSLRQEYAEPVIVLGDDSIRGDLSSSSLDPGSQAVLRQEEIDFCLDLVSWQLKLRGYLVVAFEPAVFVEADKTLSCDSKGLPHDKVKSEIRYLTRTNEDRFLEIDNYFKELAKEISNTDFLGSDVELEVSKLMDLVEKATRPYLFLGEGFDIEHENGNLTGKDYDDLLTPRIKEKQVEHADSLNAKLAKLSLKLKIYLDSHLETFSTVFTCSDNTKFYVRNDETFIRVGENDSIINDDEAFSFKVATFADMGRGLYYVPVEAANPLYYSLVVGEPKSVEILPLTTGVLAVELKKGVNHEVEGGQLSLESYETHHKCFLSAPVAEINKNSNLSSTHAEENSKDNLSASAEAFFKEEIRRVKVNVNTLYDYYPDLLREDYEVASNDDAGLVDQRAIERASYLTILRTRIKTADEQLRLQLMHLFALENFREYVSDRSLDLSLDTLRLYVRDPLYKKVTAQMFASFKDCGFLEGQAVSSTIVVNGLFFTSVINTLEKSSEKLAKAVQPYNENLTQSIVNGLLFAANTEDRSTEEASGETQQDASYTDQPLGLEPSSDIDLEIELDSTTRLHITNDEIKLTYTDSSAIHFTKNDLTREELQSFINLVKGNSSRFLSSIARDRGKTSKLRELKQNARNYNAVINSAGFRDFLRENGLLDQDINTLYISSGGYNEVYRLRIGDKEFALRLSRQGVSPSNNKAKGIEVLQALSDHPGFINVRYHSENFTIFDYIEGGNINPDVIFDQENLTAIISSLHALHSLDVDVRRFDLLGSLAKRIEDFKAEGSLEPGFEEVYALLLERHKGLDPNVREIEVLIHRDLTPRNIMMGEQGPVLIDTDLVSAASPFIDLAELLSTSDSEQEVGNRERILTQYFGVFDDTHIEAIELYRNLEILRKAVITKMVGDNKESSYYLALVMNRIGLKVVDLDSSKNLKPLYSNTLVLEKNKLSHALRGSNYEITEEFMQWYGVNYPGPVTEEIIEKVLQSSSSHFRAKGLNDVQIETRSASIVAALLTEVTRRTEKEKDSSDKAESPFDKTSIIDRKDGKNLSSSHSYEAELEASFSDLITRAENIEFSSNDPISEVKKALDIIKRLENLELDLVDVLQTKHQDGEINEDEIGNLYGHVLGLVDQVNSEQILVNLNNRLRNYLDEHLDSFAQVFDSPSGSRYYITNEGTSVRWRPGRMDESDPIGHLLSKQPLLNLLKKKIFFVQPEQIEEIDSSYEKKDTFEFKCSDLDVGLRPVEFVSGCDIELLGNNRVKVSFNKAEAVRHYGSPIKEVVKNNLSASHEEVFTVANEAKVFGSSDNSDIIIGNDNCISSRHFRAVTLPDGYIAVWDGVAGRASTNGTFVLLPDGSKKEIPYARNAYARVAPGTVIEIGHSRIRLSNPYAGAISSTFVSDPIFISTESIEDHPTLKWQYNQKALTPAVEHDVLSLSIGGRDSVRVTSTNSELVTRTAKIRHEVQAIFQNLTQAFVTPYSPLNSYFQNISIVDGLGYFVDSNNEPSKAIAFIPPSAENSYRLVIDQNYLLNRSNELEIALKNWMDSSTRANFLRRQSQTSEHYTRKLVDDVTADDELRQLSDLAKGIVYNRPLMTRDTAINGHVYADLLQLRFLIVVDPPTNPKLAEAINELAEVFKKYPPRDEFNFLERVYAFVSTKMPYWHASQHGGKDVDEFIFEQAYGANIPYDFKRKIALDWYIDRGVGVCAHQALFAGSLVESLSAQFGFNLKAMIGRNKSYTNTGAFEGGHMWLRCYNDSGQLYIVDPAQNYVGNFKDTTQGWNYLLHEDLQAIINTPQALSSNAGPPAFESDTKVLDSGYYASQGSSQSGGTSDGRTMASQRSSVEQSNLPSGSESNLMATHLEPSEYASLGYNKNIKPIKDFDCSLDPRLELPGSIAQYVAKLTKNKEIASRAVSNLFEFESENPQREYGAERFRLLAIQERNRNSKKINENYLEFLRVKLREELKIDFKELTFKDLISETKKVLKESLLFSDNFIAELSKNDIVDEETKAVLTKSMKIAVLDVTKEFISDVSSAYEAKLLESKLSEIISFNAEELTAEALKDFV